MSTEQEMKEEIARLKAEVERLRASSFVTAVPSEEYEKAVTENARLKAEVEHLQNCLGDAHAINAKEELKTWERIENLKAEVERLRKAGDAMARIIAPPTHGTGEWDGEWDAWNAAKEGKPSV